MNETETKICSKCGEEKQLNRFGMIRRGSKEYTRNVCKTCHNRQRNYSTSETKDKGFVIDGEEKTQYKIEKRNNNLATVFTESEIETLKNLASKNNEIMNIINNRINFEKIEDIKIKKSITISKLHHEKILEIVKNTDKNYSQIIDSLLKQALENI